MPRKSHPIDCLCSKPFGCSSKRILSMMLLKCCISLSFAASIVICCLLQWVNFSLNPPQGDLKMNKFSALLVFSFFLCFIPIPTIFVLLFLPSNIYPTQWSHYERRKERETFLFELFCLCYNHSTNSILLILDRVVILNNLKLKKGVQFV